MQTRITMLCLWLFSGFSFALWGQQIQPGACRMNDYLPMLRHKQVAVVAHPASRVGATHLVDTLLARGVDVVKIFSPEHGFRGQAEAGAHVHDGQDERSGLPLISLYGKHKKPSQADMQGVEVLVYDLQSVGLRFYTYISTLKLLMEACAVQHIPLVVLDRPNPLIQMTDGPVLEPQYASFVGALPIPIAYGMTDGELAQMMNGEGWLADSVQCHLTVVPIAHYNRHSVYVLPIKPSPNLPNYTAVYLYASLCLFEGTPISIGRGTYSPFQRIGYPAYPITDFAFWPQSIKGMSAHPKYEGEKCYGIDLSRAFASPQQVPQALDMTYLIHFYRSYSQQYPNKRFFTPFFDKLAGTHSLQRQIKEGKSAEAIRQSWQTDLEAFKKQRQKYLMYP